MNQKLSEDKVFAGSGKYNSQESIAGSLEPVFDKSERLYIKNGQLVELVNQ